MDTIQSIKDPRIVLARALSSRKGRNEHGKFLLDGEQSIDWALEAGALIEFILAAGADTPVIAKKYQPAGIPVLAVTEGVFRKICSTRQEYPAVGVGSRQEDTKTVSSDFVLVLDRLQDFGNIGTIVRSCAAFNIHHILATDPEFDPFQRQTITASRGTVFGMRCSRFDSAASTINYLRKNGFQIVATSPRGTEIQSILNLPPLPIALVVGNETSGISTEIEHAADLLVQIPLAQAVESLNVGVAAGISMYELKFKQVLTMIEKRIKATLGRELNVAGMLVQQALDTALAKVSSYSSKQTIFMMVLRCDGEMIVEHMCRQFGLLEKEVESFLNPLIKAGLIIRGTHLSLTARGEETLAGLWPVIEKTERDILSSFTQEEKFDLIDKLRRIQETAASLCENTA
ncbi:MAG: hypothetical protein JXA25_00450 [Anaerolineales bacterium]|nr:hypothetical protein [Anaerolineales bacterium]